ncbi:MAG: helix-hairpin-helix domain-containing protein, partial [Candidatus Acidiferrales bacterium]
EVIVEDTQLSLAIGKKGQNVRLASKLIGWNIDIKSEEEKRRDVEAQMAELTVASTSLAELSGVGPKTVEKLEAHGITSIEKLADMTPEQLLEIPGIGEKMVEKIRVSVEQYFQSLESQQAGESEPAAAEAGGAEEGQFATEAGTVGEAAPSEEVTEAETEAGPLPDKEETTGGAESESSAEQSAASEADSHAEQGTASNAEGVTQESEETNESDAKTEDSI